MKLMKQVQMVWCVSMVTLTFFVSFTLATDNELVPVPARSPKLGLINTATNTVSQIAQNLISRGTTNSQVLSLNLTNLVILLVIKALIFGAGHLGLGGHEGLGRSVDSTSNRVDDDSFLSESELQLILSFLQGDMTHKYDCLHYSACSDPNKASQYLTVGRLLGKGAEFFTSTNTDKYNKLFTDIQEAVDFGAKGYDCSTKFSCNQLR